MSYSIRRADLPLAIYREVAAHLQQVEGVQVELIPQQSQQFDYQLSQVDRIQIQSPQAASSATDQRVQQILAYYSDRYGHWETVEQTTSIP
jgi:hypothetical protein